MYCPIIAGADKTTVSVATGNVEYHPLYISLGNVYNSIRRAHRNAVVPIGFLAIPKGLFHPTACILTYSNSRLYAAAERKFDNDTAIRTFKRKLYHSSISGIFSSIRSAMTTPVVRRCPDGHFHRVIYDFGAFIADYPEQAYLSGIVSGWCPKYDMFSSRCTDVMNNLYFTDVPPAHRTLMVIRRVAEHANLRSCYWIPWIVGGYGRSMELTMISW